jgi:hypothetical protein
MRTDHMNAPETIELYRTTGIVSADPSIKLPIEIHVGGGGVRAVYDGEPDSPYESIEGCLADHQVDPEAQLDHYATLTVHPDGREELRSVDGTRMAD